MERHQELVEVPMFLLHLLGFIRVEEIGIIPDIINTITYYTIFRIV